MPTNNKNAATIDDDNAVQAEQQAMAEWSDDVSDDIASLPVLTLVQKAGPKGSETEGAAGKYLLPGFGVFDTVTIVPVQVGKSRRYATIAQDGSIETHCYAPVGVPFGLQRTEHGRDVIPVGIACDDCPLSKWSEDDGGNRIAPQCDAEIQMRVVVADAMMPARMIFRRTAIPTARKMAGILSMKGLRNVAFTMASTYHTQGSYAWYVPSFRAIVRPDDPALEMAREAIDFAKVAIPAGPVNPEGVPF